MVSRLALALLLLARGEAAAQQQQPDPDFDASVAQPAYPADGPKVLFDRAHFNFHTAGGRYKPFADLISNDGYRITQGRAKFTTESLAEFRILVIANALGAERIGSENAARPAFTDEECDAVRDWVQQGGSLLLITDHYPTGHAAENLGKRFGVEMSKGATDEYEFDRENGLLGDHAVTRGRGAGERVERVRTFTGQSLKGPEGSVPFLVLPTTAMEKIPDAEDPHHVPPREASAAGRAQGIALTFGKGRVVVLGEAAMFSAQLFGEERFGMNAPGIDNRQLALNVMHWLSGLVE
ncbi:MAG: DUF4350 domain-containing protein [Planctomycetes bacterium]|nr:DUF4350 domain-containing protein [Planctomycetota bacterium]